MPNTKGQVEDEITKALVRWEREYLGKGPTEAKTDILRNMIIVTLKGVLSPAEYHLAQSEDGAALIKRLRHQLVGQGRHQLEEIIYKCTGVRVANMFTDISTSSGERIFLFILEREF